MIDQTVPQPKYETRLQTQQTIRVDVFSELVILYHTTWNLVSQINGFVAVFIVMNPTFDLILFRNYAEMAAIGRSNSMNIIIQIVVKFARKRNITSTANNEYYIHRFSTMFCPDET